MEGFDEELERIKERKLREMLRRAAEAEARGPRLAAPTVVELTCDSFDEFVSSHRLALIDFWAEWCPPCRALAPIIEELASEYGGKVAFGKLNVDECPEVAAAYDVMAIPTLIIFERGAPVDRIVGLAPKAAIRAKLDARLRRP